jgi:FtsH-binding integral membrane protein
MPTRQERELLTYEHREVVRTHRSESQQRNAGMRKTVTAMVLGLLLGAVAHLVASAAATPAGTATATTTCSPRGNGGIDD